MSNTPLYDAAIDAVNGFSFEDLYVEVEAIEDPDEKLAMWIRVATNYEPEQMLTAIRRRAERAAARLLPEVVAEAVAPFVIAERGGGVSNKTKRSDNQT